MGKRGKRGEGRKASGGTGRENLTTSPNYLTSPLLSAQNYPRQKTPVFSYMLELRQYYILCTVTSNHVTV